MPLKFSPIVKVHTYDTTGTSLLRHLSPTTTLENINEQNGHVCTKKGRVIPDVLSIILRKFKSGKKQVKNLKRLKSALKKGKLTLNTKPVKTEKELNERIAWFVKHLRLLPSSQYTYTREKIMCNSVEDLRIWMVEGLEIFRKPRKLPRPMVNVRVLSIQITGNEVKWLEERPGKSLPKKAPLDKIVACHFYVNI
jgi:hypothetical protein